MANSLQRLLNDYRDFARSCVERLPCPPSSLEMLRYVHASRPVVFRGFEPVIKSDSGLAPNLANPSTFEALMPGHRVSIAVTPNGFADSLQPASNETDADKSLCFVQPLTETLSFAEFFDKLKDPKTREVLYLQSQNGNIYRQSIESDLDIEEESQEEPELSALQRVVKAEVDFMTEALGRLPDAVNMWIGDSRSTTTLHKDPYENIYTMISGSKTFTLFSPIEGLVLDQNFYPSATWIRAVDVSPLTIEIHEGESLFLPAGWWHHVQQQEGASGICVAVNYWYDQTIQADRYALERFALRAIGKGSLVDDGNDEETEEA